MYQKVSIGTILMFAAYAASAAPNTPWYVAADVGMSVSKGNFEVVGVSTGNATGSAKSGANYSMAIGYDPLGPLRYEGELEIRSIKSDSELLQTAAKINSYDAKVDSKAIKANAFYDFSPMKSYKPYVKAGIGIAENKASGTVKSIATTGTAGTTTMVMDSDNSHDLAWDVGAGLSYDVRPNIKLDVEYSYNRMGTPTSASINGNKIEVNGLSSHDLSLGIRYGF